jgi:hypothetical protein
MGWSGPVAALEPMAEHVAQPVVEVPEAQPVADTAEEPMAEHASQSEAEATEAPLTEEPTEEPIAEHAAELGSEAPEEVAAPAEVVDAAPMDLSDVVALLKAQQVELAAQRKLIEQQTSTVSALQRELDALRAAPVVEPTVSETPEAPIAMAAPVEDEQPPTPVETPATDAAEMKETKQEVAEAQADDPTRLALTDFVGAWRLPGTDAALRIGGYVKASVVNSLDPLAITDRFIVGSIPVDDIDDTVEAESSVTASQSRLNFDLREPTKVGLLRAFIEGDFEGDGDTFRLRHAFGQWNRILAGKTWSAFVDAQATPEEVDFEGLNGRINVRQAQVRVMPHIGRQFEFQLSLEDPDPQIENGSGVSRVPDLIASARFQPHEALHVKVGAMVRQIRGQWENDPGNTEKDTAWGLTLSGKFDTPIFDERDSVLFQFNGGNGIGRYVNDLSSVGSFDGRFDPVTGELDMIDVLAGYVSAQHWWGQTLRSNFTLGFVDVDYSGSNEPDDYKRTVRVSTNVFWSPTPRIDLGGELLWGKRENQDGNDGTASQVQVAAKYRF